MNAGVASLIALLAAIVVGYISKKNIGIISIGFALLIAELYGISVKQLNSGFSTSLAMSMIGVTYLFGVVRSNGALEKVANRLVHMAGDRRWLLYTVMYILGFFLSAVGPGAIPVLAIIPVLAVPVALSAGVNPVLLSLIGQMGVQSARMSPITPEAVVVQDLMNVQGIPGTTIPLMICLIVTEWFIILVSCFIFRGGNIKSKLAIDMSTYKSEPLTVQNWIALLGMLFMIIMVLAFKWNVGYTSFLVGSILVVIRAGHEKESLKYIPLNTILLILGVGILMNIVKISGGLEIMASSLSMVMNDMTAASIMVIFAGFMSFFTSGLGVVFPTLIPIAGALSDQIGANAVELVAMIVIGGTVTGFSPVSTAGALVMASVSQYEEAAAAFKPRYLFVKLFLVAIWAMIISAIFAILPVYRFICG